LEEYWSDYLSKGVYIYHIMYAVSQLAVYLGFDELYFVGCDLGYGYQAPHMRCKEGLDPNTFLQEGNTKAEYFKTALERGILTESIVNGALFKLIKLHSPLVNSILLETLDYGDSDHFASDYMLRIVDRRDINDEMTKGHIIVDRICNQRGVDAYNATEGGELEVYPRANLREIV